MYLSRINGSLFDTVFFKQSAFRAGFLRFSGILRHTLASPAYNVPLFIVWPDLHLVLANNRPLLSSLKRDTFS